MRNFLPEFNGRHLKVFTDHKALLGAFKQPTSQAYDPIAEKHINEITQWTSDIRFIDGESNTLADWLSRPPEVPLCTAYKMPEPDMEIVTVEIELVHTGR